MNLCSCGVGLIKVLAGTVTPFVARNVRDLGCGRSVWYHVWLDMQPARAESGIYVQACVCMCAHVWLGAVLIVRERALRL